MDRLTLERLESSDQGTFGKLRVGSEIFFTGELPWRDNQSNISCIPAGVYNCSFTYSNRFKRFMYQVENVNGRSGIRIHSANYMGDKSLGYLSQLHGCISLGLKLGLVGNQKSVLVSTTAIRLFERTMNGQNFVLEVINVAA